MPIREQQTTNKQHAIPQSIMSVEFKIIGDLTLKQFFFLLIFCGLAYTSFMAVQAFIFKWLLVVFFVGAGLCFAFLPLGDRGLDVWIVNFLRAMFLPNQFVYRKQEEIPNVFLYQNLGVLRSELITLTPTSSRRKIEAYLEQQEVPVDKLDIDEKSYILKVKEAYSSGYAGFSSSSVTTTVVEDIPVVETPSVVPSADIAVPSESIQITTPAQVPASANATPQIQNLTELELPAPRLWRSQPTPSSTKPAEVLLPPTPQAVQKTLTPQPKPKQEEIIKSRTRTQVSGKHYQSSYYSPTMTPDMHTGRRFINLTEEAGRGEIILPIRGERVLKSADSEQFDQNEAEKELQKVKLLDELINQIKGQEVVQKQIIESQKITAGEETKKRSLEEETQQAKQQEITKLNEERRQAEEEARKQTIKEQERPVPAGESPSAPNIIWGTVVVVRQGRKVPVPAVVAVIRNQRNEVVRAVKTGAQGKFGTTSPLINGSYTIEVDREKRSGLTYAVTAFEAKGEPIPAVEIVGKP